MQQRRPPVPPPAIPTVPRAPGAPGGWVGRPVPGALPPLAPLPTAPSAPPAGGGGNSGRPRGRRNALLVVPLALVVLLVGAGAGAGVTYLVVSDDPAAADLPTLPDRLDHRFVALPAVTPEDSGARTSADRSSTERFNQDAEAAEKKAREALGALHGTATVRSYLDVAAARDVSRVAPAAQFAVTVVPGDAGLVIPQGPFEFEQPDRGMQLSEIGGHRCATLWTRHLDPVTGQQTDGEPTAEDYQVECRAERDGLAYDISASGLTPEETARYLDLVLEKTE
ncbi:hypothetical protein KG112_08305 [Nocardioides sp. zg-ZUI104]|uniref:hypothetical protein n=1 Tax=Nocardioides faecalis TaxID=2803858 RepID=UPI001BD0C19A|nr:hypothetical protein [Nocardioides faecalis]MBS4752805.1 hypothetical protein [Nocardioides faecalis]